MNNDFIHYNTLPILSYNIILVKFLFEKLVLYCEGSLSLNDGTGIFVLLFLPLPAGGALTSDWPVNSIVMLSMRILSQKFLFKI